MRIIPAVSLGLAIIMALSCAPNAWAQSLAANNTATSLSGETANSEKKTLKTPVAEKERATDSERISALEEALRLQAAQLEQMRALFAEQTRLLNELRAVAMGQNQNGLTATREGTTLGSDVAAAQGSAPQASVTDRLATVETQAKKTSESLSKQLGGINFSGDIRLRFESFFGLSNNLANAADPTVLGNPLSPRYRSRIRARLSMRGQINEQFDWGLRFATGSFADNISTNQTLTDFFNRKPFALDQAYITYKPKQLPGLRLQGGKFEAPFAFTEMTFDQDLMFEGLNESYSRDFKGTFKNLTLVAWQLPMLERNSAFVRNANGTVSVEQSHRAGADLALGGGQIRARFEPSSKVALTLSLADQYFRGTQFISPVQVFGSQIQLPLTFVIPATATAPAQTITTQVSIPRDLLVAGNGNLGITNASNNATNRDGRLSSGFNLVDVLGRLELKHNQRFPVTLIMNFVHNTQTHDVVTAGPGGADVLLPNHENNGLWAEVQVGKTRERGDMLFGFTYLRIEKDAVLTPFNFSDVTQQSDMRAQRFVFSYAADPRVTFSLIGILTQRPHGILGAFGDTPPGSLNRQTTRIQFDTSVRF
jgi:hypothetical protein